MSITWISLLIVLGLLWPAPGVAAPPPEAACAAMGAKCFCSRTLGAAGWQVTAGFPNAYDETDQNTSDPKLCGLVSSGRKFVYSTWGAPTAVAGLNGKTAMRNSGEGLIAVETTNFAALTGRVGIRFYFRNSASPAYQSTGDGTCSNDKYVEMSAGGYWTSDGAAGNAVFIRYHLGGLTSPSVLTSSLRNKWVRIENYVSIGNYSEVYWKNITDNSATAFGTAGTPPGDWNDVAHFIHRYRADGCAGFTDQMYLLVAVNLAPGERIPVASELEGGVPPAAPEILATQGTHNLTGMDAILTTTPGPTQIGFIHRAHLSTIVVSIILGVVVWRRIHAQPR